ncbi:hypothetical protein [Brevundimonas sp.]|uniref:hypothetical protein n=1 Tax=Brevundimonas sp. TaxID=1871086 RepID=UPI00262EFCEF|nr:hypothetical protein [Brevundimonas sp.]
MIRVLALACALASSGPVMAQDAVPAPAAPAAATAAPTADEIAAAGDAYYASLDTLRAELLAARAAAGADTARAVADVDAIVATYQARADAFAKRLRAFLAANPGMVPPEDVETALTQITRAPAMVRQSVMQAPPEAAPAS